MTGRLRASTGALAVAVVIVALVPVADQIATVRAQTGTSDTVPRTAWGQPDLQGVWDFRTLTPMERPDELAIVAGGLTFGLGVAPGVVVEAAQQPAADGGFTVEQVAAGFTVYARQCGECHGVSLEGMEAPPLRGVDFLNGWAGRTTDELFAYVRDEMPPGLGGSLSAQVYLNLVAYILAENGARAGDAPLTADAAVMIGNAADVAEARRAAQEGETPRRRPSRFVNREVEQRLTPVTDALLQDPPPGDWLSWRRTRNSHGYSPLDQVTRDNVDELQLAWGLV